MKRRSKRMCKYANMGVVKVSTSAQARIITKALSEKNAAVRAHTEFGVVKTQFNADLWRAPKK